MKSIIIIIISYYNNNKSTFEERIATVLDNAFKGCMQSIIVLFNEFRCLVAHCSSKVTNKEAFVIANFSMISQFRFSWKSQTEVIRIGRVDSGSEMCVVRFGQLGFFVQQIENPTSASLDQIDAILIVNIHNFLYTQALLFIQQLFFF